MPSDGKADVQAADGLLLAFFHAIKDMDPIANNDPARAHEGWSNFCRTIHMSDEVSLTLLYLAATRVRHNGMKDGADQV